MKQMMQHDFASGPVAQDYGEILGAPFKVLLANGVVEKLDESSGRLVTSIIDLPGLIASVLQARVLHPRKLSGNDLKYIRSALKMRSLELAEALDITPEHYSRCESGTKTLSSSGEKFLRMYVFLRAICNDKRVMEQAAAHQASEFSEQDKEAAKEALAAFNSLFLNMKIEHLFNAGDELVFSFSRGPCREHEEYDDCGKDDGKWRKAA